jgi:hypothetical protein
MSFGREKYEMERENRFADGLKENYYREGSPYERRSGSPLRNNSNSRSKS